TVLVVLLEVVAECLVLAFGEDPVAVPAEQAAGGDADEDEDDAGVEQQVPALAEVPLLGREGDGAVLGLVADGPEAVLLERGPGPGLVGATGETAVVGQDLHALGGLRRPGAQGFEVDA